MRAGLTIRRWRVSVGSGEEEREADTWARFMRGYAAFAEGLWSDTGMDLPMARHDTLFVGPFAEWPAREAGLHAGDPRWTAVLDGLALVWNIGPAGWTAPVRSGVQAEVACAMPRQPRGGCPRWPMAIEWR